MNAYKTALKNLLSNTTKKYAPDDWKALIPLITEEVLSDARDVSCRIVYKLQSIGISATPRACKTMARIKTKACVKKHMQEFKVNSDLAAISIPTKNLGEIHLIMHKLALLFPDAQLFERNSIFENCRFTDIVTYLFGYIEGYVVEIQIGHPFARYVFRADSYRRDHPNEPDALRPDALSLNFWENNVYENIRDMILHSSIMPSITPSIYEELQKVYKDKDIPAELLECF